MHRGMGYTNPSQLNIDADKSFVFMLLFGSCAMRPVNLVRVGIQQP